MLQSPQTVVFLSRFSLSSKRLLKTWLMLCTCCTLRYISHYIHPDSHCDSVDNIHTCCTPFVSLHCVSQLKRTIVSVALWDGESDRVRNK